VKAGEIAFAYFARMAAARQGADPPDWALRPIPEVTHVGPPIDPGRRGDVQPINGEP
jgi:hypothetical protein